MGYLSNAGVFLIQTLFGIYEVIILLRFLLQLVRADFYNPISRFIVKATSLPLRPLRRIIPGLFFRFVYEDWAMRLCESKV